MDSMKGYTGQYGDTLTGLDYYVARSYDPVVGVFLSADVKQGNAAGMNPYAYAGGNPETYNDPTGQRYACAGCGNGNGNNSGGNSSGIGAPSGGFSTGSGGSVLGDIFQGIVHGIEQGTEEIKAVVQDVTDPETDPLIPIVEMGAAGLGLLELIGAIAGAVVTAVLAELPVIILGVTLGLILGAIVTIATTDVGGVSDYLLRGNMKFLLSLQR